MGHFPACDVWLPEGNLRWTKAGKLELEICCRRLLRGAVWFSIFFVGRSTPWSDVKCNLLVQYIFGCAGSMVFNFSKSNSCQNDKCRFTGASSSLWEPTKIGEINVYRHTFKCSFSFQVPRCRSNGNLVGFAWINYNNSLAWNKGEVAI